MVGFMRAILAWTIFSLCVLSSAALAKDLTIHGFVTSVNSPTSFEIDDYKVTRDKTVTIDFEKAQNDPSPTTLKPEDIRTGTELEIKGEYDDASGELSAKSIKVFSFDTLRIKRTALLEKLPSLTKDDSAWTGLIYADGQRITVSPATSVSLKPNLAERRNAARDKDKSSDGPNFTPDSLNLDTFVYYEGERQPDGSIQAQKVEFQHIEVANGEARMWRRFAPRVTEPVYPSFQPGVLKMHWATFKIVPNQRAQDYISKLGNSLIPAHQKDLPEDNPLKIPFKFYLVDKKSFNAASYPNGVVIVNSGVFDVLENEAQLAFVLSHEISHAVEKHVWLQHQYHRNELIALQAGAAFIPFGGGIVTDLFAAGTRNQYSRSLENQADRVGLEWMLAAGYDIREAPQSWKAVSRIKGDSVSNPFWSSHDNNTTRRSYLMAEIRNNYSHADYSNLRKDSDEFHSVAVLVKQSESGRQRCGKTTE
jgi:Peptidase family M48/Domain of unknown function (DUF5666)